MAMADSHEHQAAAFTSVSPREHGRENRKENHSPPSSAGIAARTPDPAVVA